MKREFQTVPSSGYFDPTTWVLRKNGTAISKDVPNSNVEGLRKLSVGLEAQSLTPEANQNWWVAAHNAQAVALSIIPVGSYVSKDKLGRIEVWSQKPIAMPDIWTTGVVCSSSIQNLVNLIFPFHGEDWTKHLLYRTDLNYTRRGKKFVFGTASGEKDLETVSVPAFVQVD